MKVLVDYIDGHREDFGVEPICRVLSAHGCKIAPSTYYAAKSRPLSARARRDAVLMPVLLALWTANFSVYGAHKLWKAARRAGHRAAGDYAPGPLALVSRPPCARAVDACAPHRIGTQVGTGLP